MTTPTNWPNTEQPGVPLFPDRDGWHWISYCGTPRPLFWSAKSNTWFSSSGTRSRRESTNAHWEYISPTLTPTQIAEMLAGERERSAQEAISIGENWNGTELSPTNTARHIAHAIRNLGDAT